VSPIATYNMNPLFDIALTLSMLVFFVVAVAVTAKTFGYAAALVSWFRRRPSSPARANPNRRVKDSAAGRGPAYQAEIV